MHGHSDDIFPVHYLEQTSYRSINEDIMMLKGKIDRFFLYLLTNRSFNKENIFHKVKLKGVTLCSEESSINLSLTSSGSKMVLDNLPCT